MSIKKMYVFVNGSLRFSLSLCAFENFTICNCTYKIHNVKLKGQRFEQTHTHTEKQRQRRIQLDPVHCVKVIGIVAK